MVSKCQILVEVIKVVLRILTLAANKIYNLRKSLKQVIDKYKVQLDRIKFEFEIPVDEDYYKNCKEGDVLGQDNRFMSIFHKGTITIQKKEIR